MKPTRVALLVLVAAVTAAVTYVGVALGYGDLPPIPLYAPATVAFLGIAELATAASVRARLQHQPGTRPVDPLVVARLVALAKASAVGGALVTGGYAALLAYTGQGLDVPSKAHDAAASGFGAGAGLLLVVAALVLERVCRAPEPPDDALPRQREWDPLADLHRDDRPPSPG